MNVPFKDWDSIDGSSVDEKEILTSIHDYSYPVSQNDTGND